jgi:hypothetical protein
MFFPTLKSSNPDFFGEIFGKVGPASGTAATLHNDLPFEALKRHFEARGPGRTVRFTTLQISLSPTERDFEA